MTKAPKLKKEDGLIDWGRDAGQVANQIRAMQPWPTPYTFFHSEGKPPVRVIINKVDVAHVNRASTPAPGHLWTVNVEGRGSFLCVDTGTRDYIIQVKELQPAGKKRMSAADFLRGRPIREGDRFGLEKP